MKVIQSMYFVPVFLGQQSNYAISQRPKERHTHKKSNIFITDKENENVLCLYEFIHE